jgi:hypothetical protein
VSDDADLADINFEARKVGMRQTRDGIHLTLEIHPEELPTKLLTAPINTRYRVGLLQIADDETPVVNRSVTAKARYRLSPEMDKAFTRCRAYCRSEQFQQWADGETAFLQVTDEESAAEFIRQQCLMLSTKDISVDPEAYAEFLKLEARYLDETGQRAAENV